MSNRRPKPPSRTNTLPASLRAELVELGKLPAAGKSKGDRKEKRKIKRDESKTNRAKHFAEKKRKVEEVESEPEEVEEIIERPIKKSKIVPKPVEKVVEKKMTPLERLLAKQTMGTSSVDVKRKKNKVESTEDLEIAWLEAKLGVRGGPPESSKADHGKWNEEMEEDGLDGLFAGLDDLESAAFGSSNKDYSRLQKADELENGSGSEEDEFGIDEDELIDPSDDDDHSESGEEGEGMEMTFGDEEEEGGMSMTFGDEEEETGVMSMTFGEEEFDDQSNSEEEEEGGMSATFGGEDFGDLGDSQEEESEEEEIIEKKSKGKKSVKFDDTVPDSPLASTSTLTDTTTPTRYVPPHLRPKAASTPSVFAPEPSTSALPLAEVKQDPRLRRQIMGHLNKLSSSNISTILKIITALYVTNPRATISAILTSLLLEIVSGRDNLGEAFVINYAALVAALGKEIGIEFTAGVIAKAVMVFDKAYNEPIKEGEGFEGRPGSKVCENVVTFLAELYNFGVVACLLVYDLVRLCIEQGLGELEVELLVKIVKRSGQQLRQDDPTALKEIIGLVKAKILTLEAGSMNSRTSFMIDTLTNLKNNKIKPTAEGSIDNYSNLKKFLTSLKTRSTPDALRLTLKDIRTSDEKGKWWIVGAAWGGDPLVDAKKNEVMDRILAKGGEDEAALAKLAKKQGMNTDIRKSVFNVLMSSEDYVDACERLLSLGLTDIQQREIARILLQCSGNEKTYNPYYTLVAFRLSGKSRSFQITLQYCLWDFLRELGEKTVGGEEMVKGISDTTTNAKVSKRRVGNLAKLYGWCVAKDVLSLTMLKPIPFLQLKPQTHSFLQQFFTSLLLSTQSTSPALILSSTATRKDKVAIEKVFVKTGPHSALIKGMTYFLEIGMEEAIEGCRSEEEGKLVKWAVKIALSTLNSGGGFVDLNDLR